MRRKDKQIYDYTEIESIILNSDVCRIAMADNGFPYIVTMSFGYSGAGERCFYFHCATEGRKLEMIKKNRFVCFELDIDHKINKGKETCDCSMDFRSVVGWGNMVIVNDYQEKKKGLDTIMAHYSGPGQFSYKPETFNKMLVLRLDVIEMTGKRHNSHA